MTSRGLAQLKSMGHLLSSKPIRIFLISSASALILTMIAFRVESLLFQRRVVSFLSRMAQIRLDISSEQELFELLPGLQRSRPEDSEQTAHETVVEARPERYALIDDNMQDGFLPKILWWLHLDSPTFRWLFLLGHRF